MCGGEQVRENALVPESAPVPGSRDFGAKGDAAPGVPEAVAWDERLLGEWGDSNIPRVFPGAAQQTPDLEVPAGPDETPPKVFQISWSRWAVHSFIE